MIPRWPAPRTRRTPHRRRRAAALTGLALAAALVQVPAARAATPPAPPSDAKLAAVPARHDATREQFYFVMPDRFANGDTSNDRGGLTGSRLSTGYDPTDKGFYQGGDLKGLTKKLDYIKGLGTTAIWLAPIFKNRPVQGSGANASAGYHGYWITDFTHVDPHFGTDKDLKTLISQAHAKGMKVFFDVITNHTADLVDYEEKSYDYLSKGAFPYLTKDGRPFDDADYADGRRTFPAVDADSFPRTPRVTSRSKVPSWLNDPAMYHNRGDSTYAGESATYGDFSGLDDLWTERPEVVHGMERIYQRWVKDFAIDGFRIDTVKHVNMDFWTQWATALDRYAPRTDGRTSSCSARSTPPTPPSPPPTSPRAASTPPSTSPSRTRPAPTPRRAAARRSSRASSVTTTGTPPTRPTPTSRSPSSATTTWAASGTS